MTAAEIEHEPHPRIGSSDRIEPTPKEPTMNPSRLARRVARGFGACALLFLAVPAVLAQQSSVETALELPAVAVAGRVVERNELQGTSAVDVIEATELRDAAAVGGELGEALELLLPSFNFPRQSNSVTSDHIRSAQLRGLSPDQVLVLVNGQRWHTSAVVNDNTKIGRGTSAFDFNTIPVSAVKRVEILRDGAGAQYGSDAIAGVINIVLDDTASGGRLDASAGLHHTRVGAIDRSITDGETLRLAYSQGVTTGAGGFRFGVELLAREPTDRSGFDRVSPFIPQTPANLAFRGQRTHRLGDPETREVKGWFNGEWPDADGAWYAFGTLAARDTEGAAVYRYPDSDQNVPALYPDGFRPTTLGENLDYGVTAGRRHPLGEWSLDASAGFGRNRFEFGVRNSLNPSLGPDSPTRFDSGTFEFHQARVGIDAAREFDVAGAASPLGVLIGAQFRHEAFDSEAGDPASYAIGDYRFPDPLANLVGLPEIGAQGAQGLSPDDAADIDRQVVGLFAEASIEPVQALTFDVAARVEDYSDFGTTFDGKLGGRFEVDPALTLRASLGTSFRAPSLTQVGWSRRDNTFGPNGERISSRLVRAGSPLARGLGFEDLEEETAVSGSIGIAGRFPSGFYYALDAFRIDVDDRITLSEALQDPGLIGAVQQLPGGEGVESISVFTNAVDTRTRGVELVTGYSTRWAEWRLELDGRYAYSRTRVRSINAPPPAVQAISDGVALIGVEEINTIETATPDHRAMVQAQVERGAWRGLLRARYADSVERVFSFARQTFGAETAFDAELGWRSAGGLQLAVGAQNLFDERIERSNPSNDFFGNFAYDVLHPVGVNGRYLYARVGIDF